MFDAIKNHTGRVKALLKLFIFILLVLIVLLHFDQIKIQNPDSIEEQQIYILGLSLNNCCTIITMFAAIAGGCWAIHQYDKSRIIQQQEKASEIAQDFANNLIEKTALISDTLMINEEFQKMITKIVKSKKLNQFTTWEITNILEDKQCFNKCEKIIRSKKTQQRYTQLLEERYSETERIKFNSNFSLLVETTLNHIEAICINISSKAAGSQFIYDSLHQSFLNLIEVLSIKISKNNYNNVDKYFINIIEVYNMWNKQRNKDIQKLNKTQEKIHSLNNKARLEINKLLNKKSKTV